jgi:hypothetical protein
MNENLTVQDVYVAFRKAQSEFKGRPYVLPKDFDSFLEKRVSEKNKENLIMAKSFFNTKWKEIDPYRYFLCGFELYKSFSYNMFFKPNIINLYKNRDKILKRDLQDAKVGITNSLKFLKLYLKENNIDNIAKYCRKKIQNRCLPVKHYLENNIDKFFLIYLIRKGFLMLEDDERALLPYVVENYREIVLKFNDISDFITKIDKIIDKIGEGNV